ncbi:MAG: branched-chain amino acid ABC transporter permease, partial [Chloroflexota bacterium]
METKRLPATKRKGALLAPQRAFPLLLLAVVLAFPLSDPDDYLLRLATNIFYFGALGCAWNLIGGFGGQLSLAHAALFALGAYPTGLLLINLGVTPLLGGLVGIGAAVLGAMAIGYPTFRLRGPYFALGTLAFNEITRILLLYFREYTRGPLGLIVPFKGDNPLNLQFASAEPYYYLGLAILLLGVYAGYRVSTSKMGYYLSAIRGDQDAAESIGIDLRATKLKALALSAALTGLVGVFYTVYIAYIDPESVASIDLSIKIVLIAIIGGMGTVWGPVLGAA